MKRACVRGGSRLKIIGYMEARMRGCVDRPQGAPSLIMICRFLRNGASAMFSHRLSFYQDSRTPESTLRCRIPKCPKLADFYPASFAKFLSGFWIRPSKRSISIRFRIGPIKIAIFQKIGVKRANFGLVGLPRYSLDVCTSEKSRIYMNECSICIIHAEI